MLSVTLKNPVKGDAHRFLSGSTDVFESELSIRFVLAMAAPEIEEVTCLRVRKLVVEVVFISYHSEGQLNFPFEVLKCGEPLTINEDGLKEGDLPMQTYENEVVL